MSSPTMTIATLGPFTLDPGGILQAAPGFGVRDDGSCYFDPTGAVSGEGAQLLLDQDGNPCLEYASAGDIPLVFTPEVERAARLRARRARNVALIAAPRGRPHVTTGK